MVNLSGCPQYSVLAGGYDFRIKKSSLPPQSGPRANSHPRYSCVATKLRDYHPQQAYGCSESAVQAKIFGLNIQICPCTCKSCRRCTRGGHSRCTASDRCLSTDQTCACSLKLVPVRLNQKLSFLLLSLK